MTKKVLIMAGGTGGHVFPGIAIAHALHTQGVEVVWLGSEGGMETTLVSKAGLTLRTLSIRGFRGKSLRTKLSLPWLLFKAIKQSRKIFQEEKPDVVLGMGGFVAGPGGIAAKLLGIPLMIHEQNSIVGWTNKILSKLATRVFCAFPDTFPVSSRLFITGNPVRKALQQLPSKQSLHHPLRLLILGGSRGAKILNEVVPQAIQLLSPTLHIEIHHQTGETSSAHYTQAAMVVPFIEDMAKAYDWADIVICRAGALTLAELTVVGIPAILVPYPFAVDDHQTVNARHLEKKGAAFLLPQPQCTPENLRDLLQQFLEFPDKYSTMAKASRQLATKEATEKIVELILGTATN